MKFYRSMFLSPYFWMSIFIWGMCIYACHNASPNKQAAAYIFLAPFLIFIGLFFMIRTTYYIVVEERKLVVKNAFCPFLKSCYMYDDIKHIEYSANSRTSGLVIVQKSGKSSFYPLECMWKKDYPRLIEMLEAKGVKFKGHEALIGKDVYNKIVSERNIGNTYKEFYKSKFLSIYFWLGISMGCLSVYALYTGFNKPFTYTAKNIFVYSLFIIIGIEGFFMMTFFSYYIVIEKEKLIIKNAVFSLFGSSFRYDNIEYIEYVSEMHFSGFTIYQKGGKHKFYRLECVRDKDYHPIIEMLQAKGVKFKMNNYLWEEYQKYLYKNNKL